MAAARDARPMSRAAFERAEPRLRNRLLDAQFELAQRADAALLVVATGVPAAGRTETLAQLVEWLDPKLVTTHALPHAERWRTPAARWAESVPARGRTSLVYGGWYEDLWYAALRGGLEPAAQRRAFAQIRAFETLLARERVRVLKLHFEVDAAAQRRHFEELRADPATRWRITPEDDWYARHHPAVARLVRRVRVATDAPAARWRVVPGTDDERRAWVAAREVAGALERLARAPWARAPRPRNERAPRSAPPLPSAPPRQIARQEYAAELERLQGRFAALVRSRAFRSRSLVVVLEGMDAAGKSGVIRRLAGALDPRQYVVIPVGAPTPEERAYPWPWRFWRRPPRPGHVQIWDRSWYGRVLVERVRGLAPGADWRRAYGEIRELEAGLADDGAVLVKCWLSIGRDEQLARFRERESTPHKRFKVDPRDWENRRLWSRYVAAARAAFERTGGWTIVPADDKRHARLAVLRAVCERLERAFSSG